MKLLALAGVMLALGVTFGPSTTLKARPAPQCPGHAGHAEHAALTERAERYAAVIAACLNGEGITDGERRVRCVEAR